MIVTPSRGDTMRRHHDPKIEWLRGIAPFAHLSPAELRTLASTADRATVASGTVLVSSGHVGRECFVLIDGEVEVVRGGGVLARLGPGNIVGELSMMAAPTTNADVIARTDLDVAVFERRAFQRALHEARQFRSDVEHTVEERLRPTA
jgi:CRP-like cAMP-binding protein